jgi:hypothetical protein
VDPAIRVRAAANPLLRRNIPIGIVDRIRKPGYRKYLLKIEIIHSFCIVLARVFRAQKNYSTNFYHK